uniref:Uncharacterized protein n=1 Tax=Romanomermis culicivorax TaxID=13658 RepID=A0A915KRQ8_ROMCU
MHGIKSPDGLAAHIGLRLGRSSTVDWPGVERLSTLLARNPNLKRCGRVSWQLRSRRHPTGQKRSPKRRMHGPKPAGITYAYPCGVRRWSSDFIFYD